MYYLDYERSGGRKEEGGEEMIVETIDRSRHVTQLRRPDI